MLLVGEPRIPCDRPGVSVLVWGDRLFPRPVVVENRPLAGLVPLDPVGEHPAHPPRFFADSLGGERLVGHHCEAIGQRLTLGPCVVREAVGGVRWGIVPVSRSAVLWDVSGVLRDVEIGERSRTVPFDECVVVEGVPDHGVGHRFGDVEGVGDRRGDLVVRRPLYLLEEASPPIRVEFGHSTPSWSSESAFRTGAGTTSGLATAMSR